MLMFTANKRPVFVPLVPMSASLAGNERHRRFPVREDCQKIRFRLRTRNGVPSGVSIPPHSRFDFDRPRIDSPGDVTYGRQSARSKKFGHMSAANAGMT
jgi:hypothetical protein